MERKCRECGSPLAGRSDKKFCSDDCRTAYHNRCYRLAARPMESVNRILRKNRRLLARLYTAGIHGLKMTDERLRGFDSRYYTAAELGWLRGVRYHCYEYSFSIRQGAIIRLRKETVGD